MLYRAIAKTLYALQLSYKRAECSGAAVVDAVDIRDYAAPTLKTVKGLPASFDLGDKVKPFSWERNVQADSECTSYSKIHQEEIKNTIWNNKLVKLDSMRQWHNQELTGAAQGQGDSLLNSQKEFFKDPQGYPVPGYFRLKTSGEDLIQQMKLTLYLRFTPIQTGLKWRTLDGVCNYTKLKETGVYESFLGGKVVGAHAIAVRGYNTIGWIIQDSLNNTYGENSEAGMFIVPYEETVNLFRMYATKDLID